MAIILSGTTGIDMGNTPVSNIVNGDNNDAVNKDYAVGKVVSTDNAIVRFDGTLGDVQNSGVTIDDSGKITCGTATGGDSIVMVGRASDDTSSLYFMNNDGATSRAAISTHSNGELRTQALAGLDYTWRPISGSELMRLYSNGVGLSLGGASFSGNRAIINDSGSIGNNEFVSFQARAGLSGTINRYMSIQVYKHSGITNPCGALQQSQQNGTAIYYWTDDVGVLRNSTVSTNIGTTAGGVVGAQTSDERVKNIVGTCPYGLQEILDLETYKYSMKDDVENSFKLGFIAQQAMGVIPESVYDTNERLTEAVTVIKQKVVKEAVKDEEGNILEPEVVEDYEDVEYQETSDTVTKLAMDYQMIIPVLVNAVKEQQELINSLTARLD